MSLLDADRKIRTSMANGEARGGLSLSHARSSSSPGVEPSYAGRARLAPHELAVCSMLTGVSPEAFAAQRGKRLNLGVLSQRD
ncbi:MAG: hypothetical protein Q7S58_05110 [Candidatus Binatus sp.]|uniref:hypothetical protein n=1 Tax=Candidatus Binatus sp. TaxID=2811406 RepID=UPI002726F82E|nr:hypothetical protein [Candidatus Binatus sp.]MDO8431772.1 hypothetical protein [Candidatus Binatus sp.]